MVRSCDECFEETENDSEVFCDACLSEHQQADEVLIAAARAEGYAQALKDIQALKEGGAPLGNKPDLDGIMRLHAKTVQGEWKACGACGRQGIGCRIVWAPDGNRTIFENGDGSEVPTTGTPADAAFVVAAHNLLPDIVNYVRMVEAERDALRDTVGTSKEVDLDALDKAHAAATPGEWEVEIPFPKFPDDQAMLWVNPHSPHLKLVAKLSRNATANATSIAKLHNTYPEMAAELRERRAREEAWRVFVEEVRGVLEGMPPSDAYVGYSPNVQQGLRNALSKVPR